MFKKIIVLKHGFYFLFTPKNFMEHLLCSEIYKQYNPEMV